MSEYTQLSLSARPSSERFSPEDMPAIIYAGRPVVTTALLARLYGASAKNISDNYLNHSARFEAGKHLFKLEGADLRAFKDRPDNIGSVEKNARSLILWTERGAARHAKILDTDKAWDVFEKLEDCYFNMAEQRTAPAAPVPTPAPFTSPTFLNLRYEGHPLRITRMAGGYWYGSSGLARALGWIDSGSITRHLCGPDQVRVVPHKGRSLMVIDHATMMVMVERAKPHLAQRFLRWLGSALRSNYGEQAPALPAPLDPLERVTGDARQLGLDWYAECRQAVHAAGGRMPALDAAAVQRAADGMAAQLVADRRWELRFDRAGLPHLKGFPDKTLVLDLDDVGALAQLVHRQTDAAALQALLDAGLKRLTALASPLP